MATVLVNTSYSTVGSPRLDGIDGGRNSPADLFLDFFSWVNTDLKRSSITTLDLFFRGRRNRGSDRSREKRGSEDMKRGCLTRFEALPS